MNGTPRVNDAAPTIEITVGPVGECTVRTTGYAGPGCRDASRFIEQALGEAAAERLTAEFYQPHSSSESSRLRA